MGRIIDYDEFPAMKPYHLEARRESIVISGESNFAWSMIDNQTGERILSDESARPPGGDWQCGYHQRRHAFWVYPNNDTGQGSVELLVEDIPKIRAMLEYAQRYYEACGHTFEEISLS